MISCARVLDERAHSHPARNHRGRRTHPLPEQRLAARRGPRDGKLDRHSRVPRGPGRSGAGRARRGEPKARDRRSQGGLRLHPRCRELLQRSDVPHGRTVALSRSPRGARGVHLAGDQGWRAAARLHLRAGIERVHRLPPAPVPSGGGVMSRRRAHPHPRPQSRYGRHSLGARAICGCCIWTIRSAASKS